MSNNREIALVVGARPNFMKAAPLLSALNEDGNFSGRLIHTGQHFDANMSKVFFQELGLPEPNVFLNINRTSPANQIGQIMLRLEDEFKNHPVDLVIVFGDVNSTLAAAVTANKLGIPLAHVEAGLRSYDRSMPEEHNRVVTDMLADLLFTPSPDANENLFREGVNKERIHLVGNIMVDSLVMFMPNAKLIDTYKTLNLQKGNYALVTLHRPSNVDDSKILEGILSALGEISKTMPVIFPVHPRTRVHLDGMHGSHADDRLKLLEPQSYLEFLNLMMNAGVVLTDSGGIQEETTVLGVPCLTLRNNTERPITITEGTNQLVGSQKVDIIRGFEKTVKKAIPPKRPKLWDGKTGQRIVEILREKVI